MRAVPIGAGESAPDVRQGALGGRRAGLDVVTSGSGSGRAFPARQRTQGRVDTKDFASYYTLTPGQLGYAVRQKQPASYASTRTRLRSDRAAPAVATAGFRTSAAASKPRKGMKQTEEEMKDGGRVACATTPSQER
jgi:hypothetical protein